MLSAFGEDKRVRMSAVSVYGEVERLTSECVYIDLLPISTSLCSAAAPL